MFDIIIGWYEVFMAASGGDQLKYVVMAHLLGCLISFATCVVMMWDSRRWYSVFDNMWEYKSTILMITICSWYSVGESLVFFGKKFFKWYSNLLH